MSMVEYQTLYYIMYREALEKLKEQEQEKEAARDDEIKRQINRGGGSDEDTNVFTDEELRKMGIDPKLQPKRKKVDRDVVNGRRPPEAYHAKAPQFRSDIEEMLEEEGLEL